jgi:hypothetical protein
MLRVVVDRVGRPVDDASVLPLLGAFDALDDGTVLIRLNRRCGSAAGSAPSGRACSALNDPRPSADLSWAQRA